MAERALNMFHYHWSVTPANGPANRPVNTFEVSLSVCGPINGAKTG